MNKEIIYKEDALQQLRLNDRDVIYIDKQEAAERIRKVPAAIPRHGQWIHINILQESGITESGYQCSYCKYIPKYKDEYIYPTNMTLLCCPNCGTQMDD